MSSEIDLVNVLRQSALAAVNATSPVNILFGTVSSIAPLKIKLEQKFELEMTELILSRNVTDYEVEMTVDHTTENRSGGSEYSSFASHNHEYKGKKKFLVHNALKVNEKVILLRLQGGKKFLIIDRVVV